jgi:hypothetical protein
MVYRVARCCLVLIAAGGCVCNLSHAGALSVEIRCEAATSGEGVVEVTARIAGPSWQEATELSRLRVFLDDQYRQDVLLVPAGELFTYRSVLGWVEKGDHSLRLEQYGCSGTEVDSVSLKTYPRNDAAFGVLAHSPFLYLRADSVAQCSDIPLLMWHELERRRGGIRVRYTVLFSNEDGGTPAPALMARWGRTTDIEWIYVVDIDDQGKATSERYQSAGHGAPRFDGDKVGNHPLLGVRTTNNMVGPAAEGEVRVGLYPLDTLPADEPRERMMDLNPWTFRIMGEELEREGKVESPPSATTLHVSDPRNYLYCDLDCRRLGGAEAGVEVVLDDGRTFRSDHGMSVGATSRHGFRRVAVELPADTSPSSISRVNAAIVTESPVQGSRPGASADDLTLKRWFLLGPDWNPRTPVQLHNARP